MTFIKELKRISRRDIAMAGGKGASLGELTRVGMPVPSGFVILSTAFEKFLEETDLNVEINTALDSVNRKEIHTAEDASEKIQALILNSEIPRDISGEIKKSFKKLGAEYVAVRSSATAEDSSMAAWAGQLESYLNTTEKNLLENVKKCWASLFTPMAIFYRFENNLRNMNISVAVVVQKMIQSEISGVCFTAHPVTKSRDRMVIEAGYGLGEAIVGGIITPDTYIIRKKDRAILDKNVSRQEKMIIKGNNGSNEKQVLKSKQEKQKLPDTKILKLAEICKKIENYYKSPQDIEWAFKNDNFYIIQSRPITTL
ncbi:MAG: hypothetical protein COV85_01295 [Candidatus Portnoybacteria bacterium CG11_big_fil_rev_8_21_14_0_20_44_10]|uniref:Phosphoenolpyruvate synthase n=2 Tax=Candidatus Portnoyibacteriota TaxID=1817913 RepID=A0A2H0KT29_9BACT|nr:MAG: hypothetical protein COV85_01295 [Candidatus Portnoybacteria bacterium CG11_big_fil_rev_8_21_14_0_20_44_10]PJA63468.1 MAG: hypothetical protein CO161_00820 [Candidatus Portnoybacteria bacterium CG_4_9_14_3_um_filter_44_9]